MTAKKKGTTVKGTNPKPKKMDTQKIVDGIVSKTDEIRNRREKK